MEIHAIGPFLDYYEGIRKRTRRVVACIPDERMEWSHAPGRCSFGDLIRHLAALERYMFAENAAGRPSRYPGHGRELAEGADEVRRYISIRRLTERPFAVNLFAGGATEGAEAARDSGAGDRHYRRGGEAARGGQG